MSLSSYQNTWIEMLMYPERSAEILASTADLTPAERILLAAVSPERLQTISKTVIYSRISAFVRVVPANLRSLLPADRLEAMARDYAYREPLASLYPLAQQTRQWLDFLAAALSAENEQHLRDLIRFEQLKSRFSHYEKPAPRQKLRGPVLSPACGLLLASPDFAALLQAIWQEQSLPAYDNNTRQGYLVFENPEREVGLLPLHWGLYHVLQTCNGQQSWAEVLDAVCKSHPELTADHSTLCQWEAYLRQRGWLRDWQSVA
ncbi:MAG: hypothetical protein IGS03_17815 [Candidatus Sericytochromatia bacterium]|nr:hypothetical protein [Candidatus Sericytochromatia bacterium]